MHTVTSLVWWRAAGLRAVRTTLVALVPLLPTVVAGDRGTLVTAGLTSALAAVLSLATSLASLPEVSGTARRAWVATLDRFARTFGQVLVAGLASAALITDVDWRTLLLNALVAGVGSLLLAAISTLPETQPAPGPAEPAEPLELTPAAR